MKTTPYTDLHIELGAKMAEFAGYNMPIQYEGLTIEHNNVRSNVGVFDVSHMGEFRAKGPKAKEFMQKFMETHKATCCRVLTRGLEMASPERKAHCSNMVNDCQKIVESLLKVEATK